MYIYILRSWKRRYSPILLITLGLFFGFQTLSLGLSSIQLTYGQYLDKYSGDPNKNLIANIRIQNSLPNVGDLLNSGLWKLAENAQVYLLNAGRLSITSESDKNSDFLVVPLLSKAKFSWHPPLIRGRYFNKYEATGDDHLVVIGKMVATILNMSVNDQLSIEGENYKVIAIAGREYRETQWDDIVYIPLKAMPRDFKNNLTTQYKDRNGGYNITLALFGEKEAIKQELESEFNTIFDHDVYFSYQDHGIIDRSSLQNSILLTFIITSIIFLVSLINVSNLTIFWVMDRKRELGIMKAIGAKDSTLNKLIILEMSLMGTIAAIFSLLCHKMLWIIFSKKLLGFGIDLDVTLINYLVSIPAGLLCGFIASIGPLKFMMRMNPIEILMTD